MKRWSSRARHAGLVSAVVGAAFIVYALSKGPLTAAIVAEGWQLGGLSPERTALLVHLVEEVPLVVMAALLVGLRALLDVRGRLARAGLIVSIAGIGLTIASHIGEHVLSPVTVPAVFGDADLLVWSYYLAWVVLYTGLSVYGLALLRTGSGPTWLGVLFAALLPGVFFCGVAVVILDLFTLAGTFRIALGSTWLVVGTWLYATNLHTSTRHAETVTAQD